MKIAVYYNLPFGGAKRSVQEHVKGLSELGHVVDVYTLDKERDMFDPGKYALHEYRYTFNPHIFTVSILSRIQKDYQTFQKLQQTHQKIAHDIDIKDYDLALVHHDVDTNTPYLLRYLKTNNVFYCMEPLRMVYEYALRPSEDLGMFNKSYESINRALRKRIDRTNILAAQNTLAISYFGRECMIRSYNVYPQVVYLGVDESIFRPMKIKKKNQVLFLAEKESIYGYDFAVEAMSKIPGSIRPELKIVYGTKGKSSRISDEELVKIYNESIATLSLSKFDTFGLVPLESMACGVPVIAFNVAGYRETIENNKTGYLVEFDAQEIADKIQYLMKHQDVAERMGQEGIKSVKENWTWEIQIDKLNEKLRKMINR